MLDIRLRKRILQFFNQNLQYIYIQLLCQNWRCVQKKDKFFQTMNEKLVHPKEKARL